jgi:5'-nucleotidase
LIVLVTNDDGFDSPGLHALAAVARQLPGAQVYVVAPDVERSGSGHSITLRRRISVQERGERAWALGGTPADCVRVALHALLPGRPDLVLSGANRGYNLGTDVYYSGTVSAAIEATVAGLTAVAVSQEDPGDGLTLLGPLLPWLPRLLMGVARRGLPPRTLLNVNVPRREPCRGMRVTRLGVRRYSDRLECLTDEDGRRYFWLGGGPAPTPNGPGTDVAAVEAGYVSVTPILLDLTHRDLIPVLRAWVEREVDMAGLPGA